MAIEALDLEYIQKVERALIQDGLIEVAPPVYDLPLTPYFDTQVSEYTRTTGFCDYLYLSDIENASDEVLENTVNTIIDGAKDRIRNATEEYAKYGKITIKRDLEAEGY